jgi:monoterpene epsilon-lactone hydrolase
MASAELEAIINGLRSNPYTADKSLELLREESESKGERPLPEGASHELVDAGGVSAEWVNMPASRPDRLLLFMHGGGYYRGSARSARTSAAWIAGATAARVLSIDYRLAPEHPFPAAIEDTQTAYRWLLSLGLKPERIVVGGVSAGGGLALALLLALRDAGEPMPAGAVPMSAWTDLAQTGASFRTRAADDPSISKEYLDRFASLYLNGADPRTPLASPLYGDLRGLPKMLLQVGTAETMLDDSRVFAERAKEAGVDVTLEEWPEMFHGWHSQAYRLAEARDAVARIGDFYREVVD